MKRIVLIKFAAVLLLIAGFAYQPAHGQRASTGAVELVPLFEVDPAWPKLPNNWVMGLVSSVAVDGRDHVWILHRPRVVAADKRQLERTLVGRHQFIPTAPVAGRYGPPQNYLPCRVLETPARRRKERRPQ